MEARSHAMAPASLEAWDHVLETLAEREWLVLLGVYQYLQQTGFEDVTGGELAIFLGLDKTQVRPRITSLCDQSLLEKGEMRPSRAGELSCHPVRPTLPRAAVERARNEAAKKSTKGAKNEEVSGVR